MLNLKYYLLALFVLILIGCEQISNSQKSSEKIYEVARLVNGTIIYGEKTLNQINKEDLTNANFSTFVNNTIRNNTIFIPISSTYNITSTNRRYYCFTF